MGEVRAVLQLPPPQSGPAPGPVKMKHVLLLSGDRAEAGEKKGSEFRTLPNSKLCRPRRPRLQRPASCCCRRTPYALAALQLYRSPAAPPPPAVETRIGVAGGGPALLLLARSGRRVPETGGRRQDLLFKSGGSVFRIRSV